MLRRRRTSSLLPALVALGCLAHAHASNADILPAGRRTVWNPGIPGGVPVRTTVCATINAATYGNGSSDATAGIQAALDACPVGQVVKLSAGDFKITATLEITKGIVLRGQGPALTRLKMPVGTNANVVTVGQQWFPAFSASSTNLAGDAVKGSQTVALVSNPGLTAGEIVLVDQLTNPNISLWSSSSPPGDASRGWFCRFDRPLGQMMEVASVSGNTVTFTTPFHIDYQTAYDAQLTRLSDGPVVKYAGLEDLYLSGGSQGQGNIWLHAAYSWVKNIESDYQSGSSIDVDASFRCIVRDSYFHSTQDPFPGGGGYGLAMSWYAADNLIENNIVWNMNKVMVMRATGGGNVIGYNYMEDGWIDYATGWVESGLNASHMTTAHFELFEGNQSFNFDGDDTWGGAVYIVAFRNHLTGRRRSVLPLLLTDDSNGTAIQIAVGHWWYTFIGNVLGRAGQSPLPQSGFTYQDFEPWDDDPFPMWRLGRSEGFGPTDPKVVATTVRDGNYDYVTGSVHWDNTPQTIPNSLYLASKPAFFGPLPWPWVDPTGTTKVYSLPARARFDAGPGRPYNLTVAATGTGRGTITSVPAGISCGADCAEPYTSGTVVTLTAAATAGSSFAGWGGACTGTASSCQVFVDGAKAVTATFMILAPVWHDFFAVSTLETPYVGDFNGDGKTDIITFTRQNPAAIGDVYVALSDGTKFGASAKWSDWFAITTDETVVIGDFNGDGKDDIATWLGKTTRQVYVARSLGNGMTGATVWLNSIGFDPSDVPLSGDVNGDGKKDLILFARKQGKVYVALSDGTKFGAPTLWHSFFAVSTYERPRVADVNGDGKADIVTFATDSPTAYGDVYVALSNGTKFVNGSGVPNNSDKWHDWFAISPAEQVRIGDLNGDGKADFFTFLPLPWGQCYTVLSQGTSMAPNVLWPQQVLFDARDVPFVGDANGDGKADIILFAQGQGKVYVSLAP